jgi:hypothetical protein
MRKGRNPVSSVGRYGLGGKGEPEGWHAARITLLVTCITLLVSVCDEQACVSCVWLSVLCRCLFALPDWCCSSSSSRKVSGLIGDVR